MKNTSQRTPPVLVYFSAFSMMLFKANFSRSLSSNNGGVFLFTLTANETFFSFAISLNWL